MKGGDYMKKGFEGGSVVPIRSGNSNRSAWPQMVNQDANHALRVHPILRIGATNIKSYGEWLCEQRSIKRAKSWGNVAARLREKRGDT